jgi:histidine triad (HIT) family protein
MRWRQMRAPPEGASDRNKDVKHPAKSCVFCRILRGEVPASIIIETTQAMALMDINQPMPGHVLVIPRAHIENIYDLDPQTGTEVFDLTLGVAKAVKRALQPDGLDLFQANERAGQQSVFHFHMHIIARYVGDRDRIRFSWEDDLAPKSQLDQLAGAIRSAIPT